MTAADASDADMTARLDNGLSFVSVGWLASWLAQHKIGLAAWWVSWRRGADVLATKQATLSPIAADIIAGAKAGMLQWNGADTLHRHNRGCNINQDMHTLAARVQDQA